MSEKRLWVLFSASVIYLLCIEFEVEKKARPSTPCRPFHMLLGIKKIRNPLCSGQIPKRDFLTLRRRICDFKLTLLRSIPRYFVLYQ